MLISSKEACMRDADSNALVTGGCRLSADSATPSLSVCLLDNSRAPAQVTAISMVQQVVHPSAPAQVAAVSEAGRAYVWECRADASGRVEAALRARVSVGSRCGQGLFTVWCLLLGPAPGGQSLALCTCTASAQGLLQ